ncbi:hypothetical protein GCM10023189_06100 [Nibrella saemangeumensis]|uniref:DUF4834 domain-containing protein n=1 Tax=Nibrella saemangeumensis TaxID=1084526 RepID=A0ABP8MEQ4_9BACT
MLIKYLFIAFLIIVFVPPVRRFVFYLLVGRQLVKEQKKQTTRSRPGQEGKTRVDNVPPNPNDSKIQGGEYVDYEEVK